jgi:glutamyl-tRNA synthetase
VAELENAWSQKHRLHLYNNALQQLRDGGRVFACNCSRTTVLQSSGGGVYPGTCLHKGLPFENNAWRLDTTHAGMAEIRTLNGSRQLALLPADMQYFVVNRKDGNPAYQLTSVIDDLHFGVDMVVRGADLWASTIAQHCLAQQLKQPRFGEIVFYHHALLTGEDGKKLSKSAGSTSVQYLRKQGKTASEIYRMMGEIAGLGEITCWKDMAEQAALNALI